jgi:hypothetical protein
MVDGQVAGKIRLESFANRDSPKIADLNSKSPA